MTEHDLDAARDALAAFDDHGDYEAPVAALRDLLAALPHLQDLAELQRYECETESGFESFGVMEPDRHGAYLRSPTSARLYCEGQVQAFRAVQTEIERRIGEGQK